MRLMVTEVISRRSILAGVGASLAAPHISWASVGAPDFLSGVRKPNGSFVLVGLRSSGEIAFEHPLPGRGHAAAVHPHRALAVAFARRPGTFGIVIDCKTGQQIAMLAAPQGRHFYGHGAFSADGNIFFATENDYEAGLGVISVWRTSDFSRLGEFSSGGTGPHDIMLSPGGASLIVANGGIETHPDAGRAKLNISTMQPNLSTLGLDGTVLETVELDPRLHKNSIRHLSQRQDGLAAFAMQWQGEASDHPALLGLHKTAGTPVLLTAPKEAQRQMRGYAGSIAFSQDGSRVAITSPRGGVVLIFDAETGQFLKQHNVPDVCGLGASGSGFLITSGSGAVGFVSAGAVQTRASHNLNWDNHLVALPQET